MGNFSRNTFKLTNILHKLVTGENVDNARHYVGVRLQQGVPLVDADWNEMEDIRGTELEMVLARTIGNGVPSRSDGFRVHSHSSGEANFLIEPGLLFVDGWLIYNSKSVDYKEQPHRDCPGIIPELPENIENTPVARRELVYLDAWNIEIDRTGDENIVDERIEIETCVRLERVWVVRMVPVDKNADALDLVTIPNRQSLHRYYPLATINRPAGGQISDGMITDLRKLQLTLADAVVSPIYVRGPLGIDKVNSGLFTNMLRTTSQVYLSLLESDYFLGDYFDDVTGVESVKVLRAFQDVRNIAESGITDGSGKRLDNAAALRLLLRLYEVQRELVDSMRLLSNGIAHRVATSILLNAMETWLEGDGAATPGLRKSVVLSEEPDLGKAYEAQIYINNELGRRAGVLPRGLLEIQFVSSQGGIINTGASYELVYSIRSILNIDENIEIALTDINNVFNFVFKDLEDDPNYPGDPSKAILMLQKNQTVNIAFDLKLPNGLPIGTHSRIIFNARSQRNPDDIDFANVEISVVVGSPITVPAANLLLSLIFPEINLATDLLPIGKSSDNQHVIFQLEIRHIVDVSIVEEFVFTVEFIGNANEFQVLGATTLNPFDLSGAGADGNAPVPFNIPIGATNDAVDGHESLMVVRLAKTDLSLPQLFFRELHIRVVAKIN